MDGSWLGAGVIAGYGAGFLDRTKGDPATRVLAQLTELRLRDLLPNGREAAFYRLSAAAGRHPARVHRDMATLVDGLADGRLRSLVAGCFPPGPRRGGPGPARRRRRARKAAPDALASLCQPAPSRSGKGQGF
ncbi:MAG TPA: hypothetical protein VHS99_26150 [Chloroflexota bacterium]|nr:hypothetical protein [Chloroflexota bacterium]